MRRLHDLELEMLKTLYELRYLATEQIRQLYYPDRSPDACGQRLRRLRREGLLTSQSINNDRWMFAWRVGPEGIRRLQRMCSGDSFQYKILAQSSLPHLLDTNQVFLALAQRQTDWGQLPFKWKGSHKAVLPFSRFVKSDHGTGHREQTQMHPDAIITPLAPNAPRVFLELDRGTEAIRADGQRATIERKVQIFFDFHTLSSEAGQVVDWRAKHFRDARKSILLFVVPPGASKRRQHVEQAWERIRQASRHDLKMQTDAFSIAVVDIEDIASIRRFCSMPTIPIAKAVEAAPQPTLPDAELLRELYRIASHFDMRWREYVAYSQSTPVKLPETRASQWLAGFKVKAASRLQELQILESPKPIPVQEGIPKPVQGPLEHAGSAGGMAAAVGNQNRQLPRFIARR